jgi:magnesium chelatase family protein
MPTRFRSGAVDGIEGYTVGVEVDVGRGLPAFHIVGLPSAAVRESRERVLSAIRNSGFGFPLGRITVNLAPADVRKEGAAFDLAIALGVIAAQDGAAATVPPVRQGALLLGELSLFGELRPVRGLLAIVLDAAQRGERMVVVPACQAWEAQLVESVQVIGANNLSQVVEWWRRGIVPQTASHLPPSPVRTASTPVPAAEARAAAFLGLLGQPAAQRAALIAAAGRHNLLLVGPPGAGKTRLARAVAGLLPPLTASESLEVSRIHSAAGGLRSSGLLKRPPFRAPHHTITRAGLIGGGAALRPGEVTLAHLGLLFLDELGEFSPAVLDVLREPLEEGRIVVARGSGARTFPASFQLVAAMNPCRCGFLGSRRRSCRCTPAALAQYRGRLSGPFLDRIDLFVEMCEPRESLLARGRGGAGTAARDGSDVWQPLCETATRSRRWLQTHPVSAGGEADPRDLLRELGLEVEAVAFLEEARRSLGLSLRGTLRCARVARTIATLEEKSAVKRSHLGEALNYRLETLAGFGEDRQIVPRL